MFCELTFSTENEHQKEGDSFKVIRYNLVAVKVESQWFAVKCSNKVVWLLERSAIGVTCKKWIENLKEDRIKWLVEVATIISEERAEWNFGKVNSNLLKHKIIDLQKLLFIL